VQQGALEGLVIAFLPYFLRTETGVGKVRDHLIVRWSADVFASPREWPKCQRSGERERQSDIASNQNQCGFLCLIVIEIEMD
jgi:hypothetical protein